MQQWIYMKQKGNSAVFLILLVLVVAGAFVAVKSKPQTASPPSADQETTKPAAFGPLTPVLKDTNEHNPDGTMQLIMHPETQNDGSTIYTFFTADISGENKKLIFTKTEPKDVTMAIHHNSFSPDNKLVIIEEHTGNQTSYLVLKASGEPFANGNQYLAIDALYKEKGIKYNFSSVTGWAGPTLAIVTTTKEDGSRGPSFWFVTDSRAFLQLIR